MSGLLLAARVGDLAKVQRLVSEGANVHEVDRKGETVLKIAVINRHIPVVKWLLGMGRARISDVSAFGTTALAYAARRGQYSLVQWLLEKGGANMTDSIVIRDQVEVEYESLWEVLRVPFEILRNPPLAGADFVSLLEVMMLLDDA
jgi:ankyrin repeat protein